MCIHTFRSYRQAAYLPLHPRIIFYLFSFIYKFIILSQKTCSIIYIKMTFKQQIHKIIEVNIFNEMRPATDPGISGGGMNDKKLEPSLHWGEEFEEGVSPPHYWVGVFTSKSRILSHILCKFVIFHTIHDDQNNTR